MTTGLLRETKGEHLSKTYNHKTNQASRARARRSDRDMQGTDKDAKETLRQDLGSRPAPTRVGRWEKETKKGVCLLVSGVNGSQKPQMDLRKPRNQRR
jgi:hypothetical protein